MTMTSKDCNRMPEPWNNWDLIPPSTCTVKTFLQHGAIIEMKKTLYDAVTTLKNMDSLHKEAALLSRFLYRYRRLFRQDKGLQNLVKMNQSLNRYRTLDLKGVIYNFKGLFPPKIEYTTTHMYLPPRQNLKWVLVRLLSFAKIFVRLVHLSKEAGKYIYGRLLIGWTSSYMIVSLATTSRIFAYSKYNLLKVIEWYNSLRGHMSVLDETVDYLPGYEFPDDMETFIGEVDLKPPVSKADIDKMFELIDLTAGEADDDVVIMNEEIVVESSESDDDVICEDIAEKTTSKRPKEDDITIVYEKSSDGPTTSAVRYIEDLGEIIVDREPPLRKKKKFRRS